MDANSTVIDRRPTANRSAVTNNPLTRADGRSPAGRRIRDLYRSFLASVGNPDDDIVRASVLAAAELTVAAEAARAELLAGRGDVEQIVRLENLANRAVRKLHLKVAKPKVPDLAEYLAAKSSEPVE